MDIQIDPHALERAEERGTDAAQILDVLRNGEDIPAKFGRSGKAKVYEFNRMRQGRPYAQKRVEVFYAVEGVRIVTVPVYVFYGWWGGL